MRLPALYRVLVLILCGLGVVWTEHYYPNEEEEYFYSLYNHHASTSQPKHRSSRSSEPVTSIPFTESFDFENEFSENQLQLFPDRLLTIDELMAEGGSGDRFPPDMQFIDDADVTTLRDHAAAADPMDTTKMPNKIHHSHIWSDNHEPAEVHTATTDEVDNFLFSVDEIIQRNLRHNNKGANKRQISPERPMLPILPAEWLNRVLQQTLEFQEQIPAFQKPLFLMPAQFPFRQQLAIVIPGQPGQPSILLPLDKSFTEFLSQSVIADKVPFLVSGAVPVHQRPISQPQHHQQRQEMPQGSSEHSHSLNSFDTNSPSAGFSQEAFVEQPIQKSRLEKIESEGNFVITNALPSSEQPPFSELLFENHMTNEESGSHFIDKSQFLNAVEEIHFVPLGSDVPLSVPPPRKLRLHDELQQAEVFAGPSNQKNGKHTPIITAIPSVVASSHKVMQRKQFANDQTSTQAQDSNTLTYPSEIFTTDEPSFSSGSFDEQTAFSDRLTQTTAHRQKRHLEQFLKEAQRSFNAGHPDATSTSWQASPSTPVPTSQPHQPSVYHASKLGIPLRREEPSPRLARQDSLVESQQAPPLVGTDGNREIRMPRTKPPSDQRPTAWIKPGYATASFSAVNQEKPPLIHRSSGQQKPPSRSATRPRAKHSPLMMALLPQPLVHPVPIPAPPQQVPPGRPEPVLPAQQEKSDKVPATAQGQAQHERPQRPVSRQDQWQQAGRVLPQSNPRQEEGAQDWQHYSQGKKEDPGLQNAQHFLPHETGRQVKGSQTFQGTKANQGTQTPVMQASFSFVAPPNN